METYITMKDLAIYIHIPFCKQKCKYCDFNSITTLEEERIEKYIKAVNKQIEYYAKSSNEYEVATVYFGGGTPSVIDEKYINLILKNIKSFYNISKSPEVTIEANPGTITREKLLNYIQYGINRISFGVQSLNDKMLKQIGRCHNTNDVIVGYKLAREVGFNNISLDLMFGLPGQDISDIENTLNGFIKLEPEHISTYSLKIEKGTPFYRLYNEGKIKLPTEDVEREMYYLIKKKLKENGYNQYEISNFSKPGYSSRHNISYWRRTDYLGFGVSASSCFNNIRFTNIYDINKYIENPINNFFEEEVLSKEIILSEEVILGLRLCEGIEESKIYKEDWKKSVARLIKKGLLIKNNGRIMLTDKGLDLANQVFVEFI